MKTTETNYTDMEQEVIMCIHLHGPGYDDGTGEYRPTITSTCISDYSGIPMKKLRGVLSSLEQKGAIDEVEFPECMVWMLMI